MRTHTAVCNGTHVSAVAPTTGVRPLLLEVSIIPTSGSAGKKARGMKNPEVHPCESAGIRGQNYFSWFSWCLGVVVVKPQTVMVLWKSCTVSVPDFAVQVYRKVPHSTVKRVKKNGPESAADYRKVMANMMIREVDEVPKKRFCQNAPQNPAFKKAC
jgi:hypothetical protein